jgi:hypothetical protein
MPALTSGDAEQLLRLVAEAESLRGNDPFTSELLAELGRLVPADWVSYNELDRVRRRGLLLLEWPDDKDDDVQFEDEVVWRVILEEHPLCLQQREGHFEAMKLSDFLAQRELHRTWVYDNWFRPLGIEHQLEVAIPSPWWHTKVFLFDRSGGRDFTERDRLILDRLQPHLARLWHAARTRRLLKSALATMDQASERDPHGVILVDASQ